MRRSARLTSSGGELFTPRSDRKGLSLTARLSWMRCRGPRRTPFGPSTSARSRAPDFDLRGFVERNFVVPGVTASGYKH